MIGDERLRPCPNPSCDRWVLPWGNSEFTITYCCEYCVSKRHGLPAQRFCSDATAGSHSSHCETGYAARGPVPASMRRELTP